MTSFAECLENAQNRRLEIIAIVDDFIAGGEWYKLKQWQESQDGFTRAVVADYMREQNINYMVMKGE